MKKNTALLAVLFSAVMINSCTKQNLSGPAGVGPNGKSTVGIIPWWVATWFPIADLPGPGTEKAFSFSIGQIGYVGGGFGPAVGHYVDLQSFFAWDPSTGVWSQKADVGGLSRESAATFVIGGNGYVTTGYHWWDGPPDPNQNERELSDTWEYVPAFNFWIQKADFPGGARESAVGMAINNMGYVGTGTGSSLYFGPFDYTDWWQFDPIANVWTRKKDFAGGSRTQAAGSSAGSFGYLGTGYYKPLFASGETFYNDWYQYDPSTDNWTRKSDLPAPVRRSAVCFGWNGTAWLGTGRFSNGYETNDFWSYNPQANHWSQYFNYPAKAEEAAGFVINGIVYVGSGTTSTGPFSTHFWGILL